MSERNKLAWICTACCILLCGCSLNNPVQEDSESPNILETQTTTESTRPDITSLLNRYATEELYSPHTERETVPAVTITEPAADTTAPPEDTTAPQTEQTLQTSDTEQTESVQTTTTVSLPHGKLRYSLSGLGAARFTIAENPLQYCTQENDSTVFDLRRAAEAAGLRAQSDTAFTSGSAKLETGALYDDTENLRRKTDKPVLEEIRYTAGGQTVVIDQQSPYKAKYCLPDGTCITKDQIMLFAYLAEQLAADPDTDPLAGLIPERCCKTVESTLYYYIP